MLWWMRQKTFPWMYLHFYLQSWFRSHEKQQHSFLFTSQSSEETEETKARHFWWIWWDSFTFSCHTFSWMIETIVIGMEVTDHASLVMYMNCESIVVSPFPVFSGEAKQWDGKNVSKRVTYSIQSKIVLTKMKKQVDCLSQLQLHLSNGIWNLFIEQEESNRGTYITRENI